MLCVTTERLPLRRPRGRRRRSIVRRGLSAHLGMPVGVIRLVMVLLVPVGFTGPLLYVWFWVTVPAGDPVQAAMDQRPAALSRLAPRLRDPARKLPLTDIGVGLVLVIGASVLIAARNGADITSTWVLPALIMLAGTALAWSQLDAIQRDRVRTHTAGRRDGAGGAGDLPARRPEHPPRRPAAVRDRRPRRTDRCGPRARPVVAAAGPRAG